MSFNLVRHQGRGNLERTGRELRCWSMREEAYGNNIRRFELEKRTFGEQYDDGLALIEETLEEFGYDPNDF